MPTFFCLCNLQMSRSSIIRPSYCSPYHHLAVHLIYFLSKFEVCQILGSFNTLLVMSDTWLKNTLLHFRFVKEILGEITMYLHTILRIILHTVVFIIPVKLKLTSMVLYNFISVLLQAKWTQQGTIHYTYNVVVKVNKVTVWACILWIVVRTID